MLPLHRFSAGALGLGVSSRKIGELAAERPSFVASLGPVSPHWEVQGVFGDNRMIDDFRQRALARLQLLPPHDPQFRRNRERVARDAEREHLLLDWDLGYDED